MVLIGVHTKNGSEKAAAFVEEQGITYPIAIDNGGTTTAFAVDSYPDYYLIDRSGKLRVADLQNADLDRALGILLAEKAPASGETPPADVATEATPKPVEKPKALEEQDAEQVLKTALAEAKTSNRRVLVHIGGPG